MRERLIFHPIYALALSGVFVFIAVQVFISGGILPALVVIFLGTCILYTRMRFSIIIGDDDVIIRSLFVHKIIAFDSITELIRTEELGKGRERFIVRYREGSRIRKIVLPSYKYRNVEPFVEELSRRSMCEIHEPHLIKPKLARILFVVISIQVLFAVLNMIWKTSETAISALRDSYMWYNYYPIWIIVAIFMIFSLVRFFNMVKRGHHYLFYYRGAFFIILSSLVMYFAFSVAKIDPQMEMYALLMQTRFENDRAFLESHNDGSNQFDEIQKKIRVKTSISCGFSRVYNEIRFSTENEHNVPCVVWVVPRAFGRTRFYASYLDSQGSVRYINESNNHVKWEEIRGAYHNRHK